MSLAFEEKENASFKIIKKQGFIHKNYYYDS